MSRSRMLLAAAIFAMALLLKTLFPAQTADFQRRCAHQLGELPDYTQAMVTLGGLIGGEEG